MGLRAQSASFTAGTAGFNYFLERPIAALLIGELLFGGSRRPSPRAKGHATVPLSAAIDPILDHGNFRVGQLAP